MPRAQSSKPVAARITEQVYFPRCEFHSRFTNTLSETLIGTGTSGLFAMNKPTRWASYHRGTKKGLSGVKKGTFAFKGNQPKLENAQAPKTGNFFSPFAFEDYQSAVKGSRARILKTRKASWYNALLKWQKDMAGDIVAKVREKNPAIRINADYGYPCVLVAIPKPAAEKNYNVWSKFVAVYVLAIANRLARERGVNIEMVRRSSFGMLRPAVADCDKSTRISLGLVPKAYAACLVDAIVYTHSLLTNPAPFQMPFTSIRLEKTLAAYNEANSTDTKTVAIALQPTLWESLWANGDAGNRSFATQFFRKKLVSEYLIDLILKAHPQKSVDEIFKSPRLLKQTFAIPLTTLFKAFRAVRKPNGKMALPINVDAFTLSTFNWSHNLHLDEPEFWDISRRFAQQINAPKVKTGKLCPGFRLDGFHLFFEQYLKDFFFNPPEKLAAVDGYGSDSDCELTFVYPKDVSLDIFGKKLITATGMRAIQLAYAACRLYLGKKHRVDALKIGFDAQDMYYETATALKSHAIPIPEGDERTDRGRQHAIGFFDVNHCNTSHRKGPKFPLGPHDRVFVLDTTSATTVEIHEQLLELLQTRPKLEVILTVSSGLKNEQGMSDYNPYGTVRMFARKEAHCDWMYKCLVRLEEAADYLHPATSHWLRRTAKEAGMTPTNREIMSGHKY